MAVMDEFREQREALKHGTPKQKLDYFWTYYKWYVIVGVALIIFVTSFIHELVTKKDDAFYGAFVNSWAQDGAEAYMQGFADKLGIDTEQFNVAVDSSLYISNSSMDQTTVASVQKLMVYIAANQIDVMVSDTVTFEQYANNETFLDLREALSPEQIEKYEPYFYYVDQKLVDEKNAAQDAMDDSYVPVYPDPSKPEEMEQPVPVAIFVESCEELRESYVFMAEPIAIGIIANTDRLAESVAFIDYLFETGASNGTAG